MLQNSYKRNRIILQGFIQVRMQKLHKIFQLKFFRKDSQVKKIIWSFLTGVLGSICLFLQEHQQYLYWRMTSYFSLARVTVLPCLYWIYYCNWIWNCAGKYIFQYLHLNNLNCQDGDSLTFNKEISWLCLCVNIWGGVDPSSRDVKCSRSLVVIGSHVEGGNFS